MKNRLTQKAILVCVLGAGAFACSAGDGQVDGASSEPSQTTTSDLSTWRHRHPKDAGVDAAPTVDAGTDAQPAHDAGGNTDAGTGGNADSGGGGACTGGGGGGPTGGPADMFPCDSPWYKDVSALPANAADQAYLSGVQWGVSNKLTIDFSIVFMHANGAAPVNVALDSSYDPDNDHVPVPVPAGGALENNAGYQCQDGGDCHLLVVDDATHRLFELWQANQSSGGAWSATQETVWDLTKHYGVDGRGLGCTSADAAGLAILPGLIGVREVAAGEIRHALRFILPNNQILHNGYVTPGTHSTASYSGKVPMGARLRLKASFDETKLPTAGARTVARALKKYGMLLADAGQDALTAESDQLEPTKWGSLLGPHDLAGIAVSDFEVVDVGQVRQPSGMDCVRE